MKKKLVVIGNGMAGMRTVEELLEAAPHLYDITVLGAEPYGNYNRILLSAVLSGEKAMADIIINSKQWYQDQGIRLLTGAQNSVVKIDRAKKTVYTQAGLPFHYDRLLIATGSTATLPPILGHQLAGVISFRAIGDVDSMLAYSQYQRHAVVLGGGLLGLEAANGLLARGMAVTVIHNHDYLLNRQLDPTASQLLQDELQHRGLKFRMAAQTKALLDDGNGHVKAVSLADGTILPCDLFVMAVGVRPNIALAKSCGLHCERGIVVDDTLQSYDPSIYAVGECIQHRGDTFGLVAPLFEQAKVCANHLSSHGAARYLTLPTATKLKVTGINVFSIGNFSGDAQSESILFSDPSLGIYKKLIIKANQLIGAILYGDTQEGVWYQTLLEQGLDISGFRESMIFGRNTAL